MFFIFLLLVGSLFDDFQYILYILKNKRQSQFPPERNKSENKNGFAFRQGFTPLGVAKHPLRVAKRLLQFHEVYGWGWLFKAFLNCEQSEHQNKKLREK